MSLWAKSNAITSQKQYYYIVVVILCKSTSKKIYYKNIKMGNSPLKSINFVAFRYLAKYVALFNNCYRYQLVDIQKFHKKIKHHEENFTFCINHRTFIGVEY